MQNTKKNIDFQCVESIGRIIDICMYACMEVEIALVYIL